MLPDDAPDDTPGTDPTHDATIGAATATTDAAIGLAERRYAILNGLRWAPIGIQLPLLVLLPSARGLSPSAIGLLGVAYGLTVILLEVPTGGLSDGRGRRPTLLAASVLTGLGLAGFATATTIVGFILANMVIAAGRSLWSGSLEAWFVDALAAISPDASTTRGFGHSSTAASISLGGMSLLSGLLLVGGGDTAAASLSRAAWVAAAVAAAAGTGVFLLVTNPPDVVRAPSSSAAIGTALRRVRAERELRKIIAVSGVHGWCLVTFELLVPLLLIAELGGEQEATRPLSMLVALAFVGVGLGAQGASPWSRRLGSSRRPLAIAFGTIAAMMAVIGSRPALWLVVAAYVLAYLGLGAQHPIERTMISRRTASEDRASLLSMASLVFQLCGVVGSMALPVLLDWQGFGLAFGVAAAVASAGAVLAARLEDVVPG